MKLVSYLLAALMGATQAPLVTGRRNAWVAPTRSPTEAKRIARRRAANKRAHASRVRNRR